MNLAEYTAFTDETSVYPGQGTGHPVAMLYAVLGLADEAGEVMGKTKKALRGDMETDTIHCSQDPMSAFSRRLNALRGSDLLKAELGDVMFYACRIARENGWTMEDVLDFNVAKLRKRKAEGKIKGNGDAR